MLLDNTKNGFILKSNFELKKDDKSKSIKITEKFRYKNLNDNYEQKNYEKMIKLKLAEIIISKLNLRINNFKW